MAGAMNNTPSLKEKIALNKAIIDSFNTNPADPAVVECVADHYYQHNLMVPDTKAGYAGAIGAISEQAKAAGAPLSAKVHRAFGDSAGYTFYHVQYNFFGPKAGFDVCRWEDGQIVEHWDNLGDMATLPDSANGNTMFDGPTEATDLDKTEENKALVAKFTFNVLQCGRVDLVPEFVADSYIQHDPAFANGRTALVEHLDALNEAGCKYYNSQHLLVGCGNFVLVGGEAPMDAFNSASPPAGVWDMYRVDAGKLVEHWTIREQLIPKEKRAHQNGKW